MGTSAAAVRFPDGTILWSTYQNTSDILHSHLAPTLDEALAAPITGASCTCGHAAPAKIAVNYGRGFWWDGEACLFCMAITSPGDPLNVCGLGEGIDVFDGLPDWWP